MFEPRRIFMRCSRRTQFRFEYFACESPLFDILLPFLSTQRHICGFALHEPEALHNVQASSTTSPLLLHPQLDTSSLRRLEYMSHDQSLREEVRAIERIYRLRPQLRSLWFVWDAGKICASPSFLHRDEYPYIYLSDISRT